MYGANVLLLSDRFLEYQLTFLELGTDLLHFVCSNESEGKIKMI